MTYSVVDKPCPDCNGQGYSVLEAWDRVAWATVKLEINCGMCMATGWIEAYKFDDGEGSNTPVEIPDSPNAPRTGSGYADNRVPVGAVES